MATTRQLPIHGQDAHTAGEVSAAPAVLQSAFRPLFILAALGAAALVPVWLAVLGGALPVAPGLGVLAWHAHEMIFGFTFAVIAGFLLTATQVWTGRKTVGPVGIAAVCGLWIAARGLALAGPEWLGAAAAVGAAVPLFTAAAIARPIFAAKSRRNYGFVPLLVLLAGAELALFADAAGLAPGARGPAEWVALDAVAIMIVVVGGRIVPMFTKNATGAAVRERNLLDRLAPWSVALLLAAHALSAPAALVYGLFAAAGAVNLARMGGWATPAALRKPFIGVLHVGYALLGAGLLLEGAFGLAGSALHPGRHVIGLGGIGVLCLGMMTRVALGHTGRPLHPPKGTILLYGGIVLATLLRLAAAFAPPELVRPLLYGAGGLFTAAFVGYIAMYAAILVTPRADGKPG